MNATDLLDAAKMKRGLDSDNKLALALGVTRGVVSQWRNGTRTPDPQAAMKLADMAVIDRLEALAICELQRETDPRRKQYWATFIPGLRRLATLVAASIVALFCSGFSEQSLALSVEPIPTEYKFQNSQASRDCKICGLLCKIYVVFSQLFGLYQGFAPIPHRA